MKKKVLIGVIVGVVVVALLVCGIIVYNNLKTEEEETTMLQNITLDNNTIEEVTLDTGIELVQGKVEKMDTFYHITMTAKNNTNEDIDMTNYRISFQDKDGNEIDWFRGAAIGLVKAGESQNFIIDSSADFTLVEKIEYQEFDFGN